MTMGRLSPAGLDRAASLPSLRAGPRRRPANAESLLTAAALLRGGEQGRPDGDAILRPEELTAGGGSATHHGGPFARARTAAGLGG